MVDTPSTSMPALRGGKSLDDRLDDIEMKIDALVATASEGKTEIALIKDKLLFHDRILAFVGGAVGLAVLAALLKLILKD